MMMMRHPMASTQLVAAWSSCGVAMASMGGDDGRRASVARTPSTPSTKASSSSSSYVDDLMRGGVDLLDISRGGARGGANATLSGMKAKSASGVGGRGVGAAAAAATAATGSGMSRGAASGEDLEAFFGSTNAMATARGATSSRAVDDDVFGAFASFASSATTTATTTTATTTTLKKSASAAPKDDLDDFFSGVASPSMTTQRGRDNGTSKNGATRVSSAGSDLFDLLSGSSTPTASTSVADLADFASRSQSPPVVAKTVPPAHQTANSSGGPPRTHAPLMSHASDAGLIDGLDEILGEVSIGASATPKRSPSTPTPKPPVKEAKAPSPPSRASPPRATTVRATPAPAAHARSGSFNDADADINEFFGHTASQARAKVAEVGASMKAGVTRLFKAAVKTTEKFTAEVSGKAHAEGASVKPEAPPSPSKKPASSPVKAREPPPPPVSAPKPSPKVVERKETPIVAPEPKPAPKPEPAPKSTSNASSVEDLDDFFSAGASATKPAASSSFDPIEAMFTVKHSTTTQGSANVPASGVVDDVFGTMDSTSRVASTKSASAAFAYAPEDTEVIDPNEPPERAALRKARHERNRVRIETALKEKRAREQTIRSEQNERQMLKDLVGADIDEWAKKNQHNIRTLLANLAEVLWEGHRYVNPTMGALMSPNGVKKSYHKALVIIHPDKVSQSGGDASQRFIADKVFDIIKNAYKEFEAKELR
jgi:hypothetical protein